MPVKRWLETAQFLSSTAKSNLRVRVKLHQLVKKYNLAQNGLRCGAGVGISVNFLDQIAAQDSFLENQSGIIGESGLHKTLTMI